MHLAELTRTCFAGTPRPGKEPLVNDSQADYERLRSPGVEFTAEPTDVGTSIVAVCDDTCGNLIQIFQLNA